MTITDKQREARTTMLGSSDLAAICGLDPWRNAADVYAEKVYGMRRVTNEAMEAGNLLEAAILSFAGQTLGALKRNQTRRVTGYPIRCNIDALAIEQTGEPVEGKSAGITNPFFKANDEWGEAGSDDVPDRVKIQTHGHMLALTANPYTLTGYPKQCHVPTLLGGRGFVMFVVPFDREAAEEILIIATAFWTDHIEPRVPPPDVTPSLQTLKRIIREPESVVDLDTYINDPDDLGHIGREIHEMELYKECATFNTKNADECKATILAALGDAEAGRLPDGRLVHYKEIFCKGQKEKDPYSYRRLFIKPAPKLLEAD